MRWEVFKQDADGKPHQAVGSVHAPDAEGALLNARHVFARRPAAVSVWVTPAAAIHSWTAEQLALGEPRAGESADAERSDGERWASEHPDERTYLVFRKTTNRRSMTFVDHAGRVEASDEYTALAEALERYGDVPVLAWWLVPLDATTASAPEDAEAWFEPARDKTYKQQAAYGRVKPGGRQSGA